MGTLISRMLPQDVYRSFYDTDCVLRAIDNHVPDLCSIFASTSKEPLFVINQFLTVANKICISYIEGIVWFMVYTTVCNIIT